MDVILGGIKINVLFECVMVIVNYCINIGEIIKIVMDCFIFIGDEIVKKYNFIFYVFDDL